MAWHGSVEDMVLNYDPEFPQLRFVKAGVAAALKSSTGRLPSTVPWPEAAPTPIELKKAPTPTSDLSQFKGYDAVVVTWTAAEAAALAAMFTPSFLPSRWYEYRHNVAAYVKLVTGGFSPFNDKTPDMARYYHSLGLYFPCQIGAARVLLFKSGLHLDYDGPATPVFKLMTELATTIKPSVFITTGTGGGIGGEVALGDVVIAGLTKFDCTTQFKSESWAKASYNTSPLPATVLSALTADLTKVNAARVVAGGGRDVPKFWASSTDAIVTTDFFGFDDSTDYYGLEALGRACDMGDAMVGKAVSGLVPQWFAIRNASDPQIPNPTKNIKTAKAAAGKIYSEYGAFTTAASAIATWAVIVATCGSASARASSRSSILSASSGAQSGRVAGGRKTFCLGKMPAVYDSRTLRFGEYLTSRLPPPPASVNWGKAVPEWPMYLNDKYGDCTCAAAGHMIQNWTANVGKERSPSDQDILTFYEHFTTPGPDNGCNMLSVLKYWRTGGLGGDKITAFAQLEPKNAIEAKDAINLFGACYIGVELPEFAVDVPDLSTVPWVVPPQGPVGTAAPDPQAGHCIPAVAYDERNLYVVTWGAIKSMSWQFYIDYADEAYAVLSSDFLKAGKAINGFNLAQLKQDLAQLGSIPSTRATIVRGSR